MGEFATAEVSAHDAGHAALDDLFDEASGLVLRFRHAGSAVLSAPAVFGPVWLTDAVNPHGHGVAIHGR